MSPDDHPSSVEARLRRLEDREAIRELRYEYAYTVDENDWEAFLDLFTDGARVELPDAGPDGHTYEGHEDLRTFCDAIESGRRFMAHMTHNALLSVDGDEAEGTWYFEVPEIVADGTAVWVQGRYEETYIRDDGTWKFDRIRIFTNYKADYDEGWADTVDGT